MQVTVAAPAPNNFVIYIPGTQGPKGDKGDTGTAAVNAAQTWTKAHTFAPDADFTPITVKANVSQTTDLLRWTNSAGTVLTSISSAGQLSTSLVPVGTGIVSLAERLRANSSISGGGVVTFSGSSELHWSARFIVISNGRGTHFGTAGYFDIALPAAGTVITGVGGTANQTVTAAGIPIPAWSALYYILPIGSTSGSVAGNFRLVGYTADLEVPDSWVLVARHNSDASALFVSGPSVYLKAGDSIDVSKGTGRSQFVTITDTQTITGAKTFSALVIGAARGSFRNDTTSTDYSTAQLEVYSAGTGKPSRLTFHIPGVIAQQIGSDDTGLRTFTQSGTGFADFRAAALFDNGNRVYSSGNANLATTAASAITYGLAAVVGTGTAFARNDHHHGTPPAQTITAGTGITATPSGVNYTIANSGVTSIVAGTNVTISGATGAVTINAASVVTTDTVQIITGQKTWSTSAVGTANAIFKAIASQTADIVQWQDSAGAILARVSSAGQIFEGANRVYSAGNPQTSIGWSGVTAKPSAWLDATNLTESAPVDINHLGNRKSGFFNASAATNAPLGDAGWHSYINVRHHNVSNNHGLQISAPFASNKMFFRTYSGGTGVDTGITYQAWAEIATLETVQTFSAVKTFTAIPVVPDASFAVAKLSATGTRDATTFLRGDNTWATVNISNMVTTDTTQTISGKKTFTTNAVSIHHGSTATEFGTLATQLLLGYAGSANYQHAIRTRHNASAPLNNAIDFFVWNHGVDAIAAEPTMRVLTIDAAESVFYRALRMVSPAATTVPSTVQGAASQTADLMQFKDSAGNVLARVGNDGTIYKGTQIVGGNAADTEIMAIMGAF